MFFINLNYFCQVCIFGYNIYLSNLCHASVSLEVERHAAASTSDPRVATLVAVGDLHVIPLRRLTSLLEGDARVLGNLLHCADHQIALNAVYENQFSNFKGQKKSFLLLKVRENW